MFEAEAKQLAILPLPHREDSPSGLGASGIASVETALAKLLQQSSDNENLLRQVLELKPLSLAIDEIAVTLQALDRIPEGEELGSFMSAILSGRSEPVLVAELLRSISEGSNALEELTELLSALQDVPLDRAADRTNAPDENHLPQYTIQGGSRTAPYTAAQLAVSGCLRAAAFFATALRWPREAWQALRSGKGTVEPAALSAINNIQAREIVQLLLQTLANLETSLRSVSLERCGIEERRKLRFVTQSREALCSIDQTAAAPQQIQMVLRTMQRHIRSLSFLGNVKSFIVRDEVFGNLPKAHTRLMTILDGQLSTLLSTAVLPLIMRKKEMRALERLFGSAMPALEQEPFGHEGSAPQALVTIRSILRGQEVVSKLNPIVQALGEPAVVFFPCLIQGMLTRLEMFFYPVTGPCLPESSPETQAAMTQENSPHVRFALTLPTLGHVGIAFAHSAEEAQLTITCADDSAAAALQNELAALESAFLALGYRRVSFRTETGTDTGDSRPEWLTELLTPSFRSR